MEGFILFRRDETEKLDEVFRNRFGLGDSANIAGLLDEMWVLDSTEECILLVYLRCWSPRRYQR